MPEQPLKLIWKTCTGEAHNPAVAGNIDHCMICMPWWERYPVCAECGCKPRETARYYICPKCKCKVLRSNAADTVGQ